MGIEYISVGRHRCFLALNPFIFMRGILGLKLSTPIPKAIAPLYGFVTYVQIETLNHLLLQIQKIIKLRLSLLFQAKLPCL